MKRIKSIARYSTSPYIIFWIVIAALAVPNVALCFTEGMGVMACLANAVLPVAALWLVMTLGKRPGKTALILFPMIFLAAFQIVLLGLYGHSIIAVDMFLNLVTTNVSEAMELLDNLIPAVAVVIVIYVPVLVLAVLSLRGGGRLDDGFVGKQRRYSLSALALGAACLGGSYAADREYSARLHLYPVNVFYNIYLAVERHCATSCYAESSAGFRFDAKATHATGMREIYVLVIGETARACNFGIYGYGRNTTPMLGRTKGLVVFRDAITQSNTTHKSVSMLLSAASAEDYGRIYHEKGIMTAFKEAGFHTNFISNQRFNHSFIDIFGKEADNCVFIKERNGHKNTYDAAMLKEVDEIISRGRTKEFIVLHSYGSHFNYKERYSPPDAVFMPDTPNDADAANRSSLLNAYDNSIVGTDRFLCGIIQRLRDAGGVSAMLYTSDHGENIYDDRRHLFLHASPIPSYYELHVPLLVWMSGSYTRQFPTEAAALVVNRNKSVAGSASVFHTVLGMAGVETPFRNDSLSVASRRYVPGERHYLNDHNEPVPIRKMLRDKEDFDMFRKMRLGY